MVQNKTAFEVPLSAIANSNIAGKNEVALEFVPPIALAPVKTEKIGSSIKQPDELVEMRFYVPGRSVKAKRGGESGSEGEEESERDEDGNEISAAQAFHDTIKDRAEIGVVAGDSLVVFNEVLVLTPR
jgi:structure-specific recognition protein 1